MRKKISVNGTGVPGNEADFNTQIVKSIIKDDCPDDPKSANVEQEFNYKWEIAWMNVIAFAVLHSMAIYGLYLSLTSCKLSTYIFNYVVGYSAGLGVSAGCHRLWTHRSYKATLSGRILLMLMQTLANQDAIYYWVRDHRVHHKFTDTNADPYNSTRGFFFSHMGWLMLKKHPDVVNRGKGIDLSDLTSDPVVAFQKKYFLIIMPIVCFIIPIWIPIYFWNESFNVSFFITMWRYVLSLHLVWTINSVSHKWGFKPYDKFSSAVDNPYTGIITLGESWHNYHHAFPWDYTVPKVPFYTFHPSAKFIELLAYFGLAYDLKSVSLDLAGKQAHKKGDGTFENSKILADTDIDNYTHKSTVWGWDDDEIRLDDRIGTEIHAKSHTRA